MVDDEAGGQTDAEEGKGRIAFSSSTPNLIATVVGEPQWMSRLPLSASRPGNTTEEHRPTGSDEADQ